MPFSSTQQQNTKKTSKQQRQRERAALPVPFGVMQRFGGAPGNEKIYQFSVLRTTDPIPARIYPTGTRVPPGARRQPPLLLPSRALCLCKFRVQNSTRCPSRELGCFPHPAFPISCIPLPPAASREGERDQLSISQQEKKRGEKEGLYLAEVIFLLPAAAVTFALITRLITRLQSPLNKIKSDS